MRVPLLETARLSIRPFALTDPDDIHRILDVALGFVPCLDAFEQLSSLASGARPGAGAPGLP